MEVHEYPLDRYDYTPEEDRETVRKAQAEGKKNLSLRAVLVASACLNHRQHRQNAERMLQRSAEPTTRGPAGIRTVTPTEASSGEESSSSLPLLALNTTDESN